MADWADLRWFVVFSGIADAWLWGFDADGWRLRHGDPARGTLGVLPSVDGGPVASLDDVLWLADALAFDHDAPVWVRPAVAGMWPHAEPKDPAAVPPLQPVEPLSGPMVMWYWESVSTAHSAAAELRFNGSYAIRYKSELPDPGTNFTDRFADREMLLALYAMATRQADLLAEYLCLYRVLEGADGGNGKAFSQNELPNLLARNFGLLRVMSEMWHDGEPPWTSVFDLYKHRARVELSRLNAEGVHDVPDYLYQIRNSIAHGKQEMLVRGHGDRFEATARALPVLKLLARVAVEP